ncbi:MAG: hypothetical protein PHW33_04705, partial [Candidatus Portnoybacteria bacterium]|nr:hypothetical protein [Candidatus Portnoybacteria bacterium]
MGLGKEPDKEKLTRLPTHEQIISTQKDEVLEPEIEEPEKTGVFSKLKSFVQKFIPEAVKTAQISDEALKARFKGTYTLLSRQVADAYRGKGIVGKLMSIPTTTFLMPKSYREKQAVKIDKLAKDLQESAFKDMEVVEDYLKKNPLAINMEGVAFTEKMKDPEFVARGLTLNAPTLLASLGISAVVALTTKNPVLAYTAAFGTGFSMEAGEAYNDALKAETTEKEARTVGVIVGSVNGLLESLFPGSKATDLMGGKQIKQQFFKKLTTTVIKDILKEGSTESLQEIVANVGRSVYEDNVDLLRGTEEAAFFGALMGGVTSISTETYQQLKSAGVEVNEEVIKEKEKPAPETQIKEEKVKTKPEVKLENILKPEQVSKAGRIKTSEIENVFNKIPDGTVSPDGYVVKKGNKLFPTEKATPEILENSGISLNKDGSIKEGFALTKTSFTEDVIKPEKIIKPKKEVRTPKEIAKLQDKVIDKKIRTTKDIKGTRDTLKTIRQELDNAVAEAEGRSIVAQEQRAGLDVDDINQLKRIYAINKKFQEGDIETIRASEKVGPLLNRVLENVQEKHPDFSEQEAFDFAIGLPTKADEKVRTSEIIQLEKKEKKLREYIDRLREKQNELKFEESELLEKEWKNVIAAQERL